MRWILRMMFALLCVVILGGSAGRAQTSTNPPRPTLPGTPQRGSDSHGDDATDPLKAQIEAQRERAVSNDRQKKIVADTEKLFALAQQLKDQVAKTDKYEMSLEVIRKAEEIEKLARDVKQRMKG